MAQATVSWFLWPFEVNALTLLDEITILIIFANIEDKWDNDDVLFSFFILISKTKIKGTKA